MQNFEWITILLAIITMTATTIVYHERRYAALELKLTRLVSHGKCAMYRKICRTKLGLSACPASNFPENIDSKSSKNE